MFSHAKLLLIEVKFPENTSKLKKDAQWMIAYISHPYSYNAINDDYFF